MSGRKKNASVTVAQARPLPVHYLPNTSLLHPHYLPAAEPRHYRPSSRHLECFKDSLAKRSVAQGARRRVQCTRFSNRPRSIGQSTQVDWAIDPGRLGHRPRSIWDSTQVDWVIDPARLGNRPSPTGQSNQVDWAIDPAEWGNRPRSVGQSTQIDWGIACSQPIVVADVDSDHAKRNDPYIMDVLNDSWVMGRMND